MELDENVDESRPLDDLGESPLLGEQVLPDTELKTWLVNYVGETTQPQNGQVTVEMIIEKMADEFPEFILAMAEENWIRGYHQAMTDVYSAQQGVPEQGAQEELDDQEHEEDEHFDEE
tara:strand:- start:1611 stop:1964 length:354 start_codon:yes stop_codon:yes gene_type:complete